MAVLLWGVPYGDDFTWDLTYKFKTEEGVNEDVGLTTAYQKYSQPTRELKFSLGATRENSFSMLSAYLNAGVTVVTCPLWFCKTALTSGLSANVSLEAGLIDTSEFYPGEQALIMRASDPSICELVNILGCSGTTVYFDTPVTNDYNVFSWDDGVYDSLSSIILPVITGILEYESLDFVDGLPGLGVKAKIDGGAWNSYTMPSMPAIHTLLPMDVKYNAPKIVRDLCGTENGIFSMYPHGDSSKLTYECTWHFINSNWKTFRDAFFAAVGKTFSFPASTNMYELVATRGSDQSSSSIFLNSGYRYLYERFPFLLVRSRMTGEQFIVQINDYVSGEEFLCEPLTSEVFGGDRVCFYPNVRFDSDDLTFSFKGVSMCQVKATFIEEPQQ